MSTITTRTGSKVQEVLDRGSTSIRAQLICVWSGVVLVLLLAIGFAVCAHFIPVHHASDSAQQIKTFYLHNLTGIRIGMALSIIAVPLMAPWGVGVAAQTARTERGFPVYSVVQLTCAAGGAALFCVDILVFAAAAFRPDVVPAQTTRLLNDLGWLVFLFDWMPFTIWAWAVALAIFGDRSKTPVFPRWVAYTSVWAGLLFFPADLIIFFKSGAFSFSGIGAMYMPVTVFFAWFLLMTVMTIKAIHRQAGEQALAQ